MRLSVVILTKNEEAIIGGCLKSVRQLADEILVVDSRSTDKTLEIAKNFRAKIYSEDFKDFSERRNLGLKKSLGDWILYVDADERVTDSLRENIRYQISLRPELTPRVHSEELRARANIKYEDIAAYKIRRKNFYLGNHEWPYIEKLERLFRKDRLKGWRGELHENPIIEGQVGELDGFLLHYAHRDLTSMLEKTIEWSKIEANLRFKAEHPPVTRLRLAKIMLVTFWRYFFNQKGWKAGTVGLIESIYQSFSMFITYARLWEKQGQEEQ